MYLRVGHGHELLEELRQAAGLHHYMVRRSGHARGVKGMKNSSHRQIIQAGKKGQLISAYVRNWARLSKLLSINVVAKEHQNDVLQGLQKLDGKNDVAYFVAWGEQKGDQGSKGVSDRALTCTWIWRVAMAQQGVELVDQMDQQGIKEMTRLWESEGRSLIKLLLSLR